MCLSNQSIAHDVSKYGGQFLGIMVNAASGFTEIGNYEGSTHALDLIF